MHQCTKRCGSGKQTRSKQVKAKFGGNNCMGSSQQDCNTQNLYENKKTTNFMKMENTLEIVDNML